MQNSAHVPPFLLTVVTINMASISSFQTLSSRGETAAKSILPVLDVISDSFSAESNPAGFISLGLAENVRITIWHKFLNAPYLWLDFLTEQHSMHDS